MIRISRLAVVAVAAAAAACGDGGGGGGPVEPPQPKPILLEMVSGNAQAGMPGEPLTLPLIVRAVQDGQPVPNVSVTFEATGGTINLSTATTGGTGQAEVTWTIPADPGAIAAARVNARLTASPASQPVAFGARGLRPDEMDLVIAEGGLPVQIVVYDRGAFNTGQFSRRDFTDSTHVWFGNPTARDELVAFTPGRRPTLLNPVWTPGRDTVRITFSPEIVRIPLTVWVVEPPFDSTAILVQRHLQGVASSWEAMAAIGLRDVRIVDATGFPRAKEFQGAIPQGCQTEIKGAIGWDEGRLNAYYVGQPPIGSAGYCGGGWMLVHPLAWQRRGFTLAHEIGHGFMGGHHETVEDNIMHFRGDGSGLTPGQMFRAHYSEWSILNTIFDVHPLEMRRPCALDFTSANPLCMPTHFVLN